MLFYLFGRMQECPFKQDCTNKDNCIEKCERLQLYEEHIEEEARETLAGMKQGGYVDEDSDYYHEYED